MTADSSLAFWLRAAEAAGALVEDRGDVALAVVPEALQRELGCAEEVAVTANPEAARDEGAVLLVPGEPLLGRMAASVLVEGDAGCGHLPWPAFPPPGPAALLDLARKLVPVDHGRIDAAGPAGPVYAGVLRVGALVAYDIAAGHRFREIEEVWVDAASGTAVAAAERDVLAGADLLAGVPDDHPALVPDLVAALRGAAALVEDAAAARAIELSTTAEAEVAEQIALLRARHRAALEALARRRQDTPPERQGALVEREQELRAEHDRRVRDLEHGAGARRVQPFRLHLVLVPALSLPVEVRRGGRRYPFTLTWLLTTSSFATPRCPSCGATSVLAAGRDRLGCRACLGDVGAEERTPAPGR